MNPECYSHCPRIRGLYDLANSYKPETVFGHHQGSALVQAHWIGQLAAAKAASEQCLGPVQTGTTEVTSRPIRYLLLRKVVTIVPVYNCALGEGKNQI